MRRFLSFLVVILVCLAGCDGAADVSLSPPALLTVGGASLSESENAWTVTATEGGGVDLFEGSNREIDVAFHPPRLGVGHRLTAQAATLTVHSAETPAGHHALSISTDASSARVQGVRDGLVVAEHVVSASAGSILPGSGPGSSAGTTDEPPTSIHRAIRCEYGTCTEVVSYDYKGTVTGTARWSDGTDEPVMVDHVRFVVPAAAAAATARSVRLTGFETLTFREAP